MKQVLFFVFVAKVYLYALADETTVTTAPTTLPTTPTSPSSPSGLSSPSSPPTPPTPRYPFIPIQLVQQGFAAITEGLKTGIDMVQKIDDTILGVNQQPASGFMPSFRG